MEGPWQDAQAADRSTAPRASELLTSTLLASAPAESNQSNGAAAAVDNTTGQGTDIIYAPIDISGFRSPMLPKLMREFSPLATVVRRPGAGETATHVADMSDRRAEEIAEQAKARSMHLVVLFEQIIPPGKAANASQATLTNGTALLANPLLANPLPANPLPANPLPANPSTSAMSGASSTGASSSGAIV